MTILRDATLALERGVNDALGDEITYTPSGSDPITFNAWVEFDTTILNPGNSSSDCDEITVEVPVATIPFPLGEDRITITLLPGKTFAMKKRVRSNTGATWVLALKRADL